MPALPAQLQRILDMEYPRFSRTEMHRRRSALEAVLAEHALDHLVFYGAARVGSSVQWITQWPVTAEAAGVFTPGRADMLHVHYYNHLALARKLAADADVAWGGGATVPPAAPAAAEAASSGAAGVSGTSPSKIRLRRRCR